MHQGTIVNFSKHLGQDTVDSMIYSGYICLAKSYVSKV